MPIVPYVSTLVIGVLNRIDLVPEYKPLYNKKRSFVRTSRLIASRLCCTKGHWPLLLHRRGFRSKSALAGRLAGPSCFEYPVVILALNGLCARI